MKVHIFTIIIDIIIVVILSFSSSYKTKSSKRFASVSYLKYLHFIVLIVRVTMHNFFFNNFSSDYRRCELREKCHFTDGKKRKK